MGRKSSRPDAIPHLRVRRKGRKTFYYYDHGGKPRREEPLGTDYGRAIQRWAEIERDHTGKSAAVVTFRYVAERYRAEVIPGKAPRTQRDNLQELGRLLVFFDDPPAALDAIQPQHVRQYLTWRRAAPVRANREKALLSHIWNWARATGYTALQNPCAGVPGHREHARSIYVEDDAYGALWEAADGPLRDALDLAYLTAQRPADVLRMDERDVREGILHVRQGKTGTVLRIVIEGELAAVLARIAARKGALVLHATRLIVDERGRPLRRDGLRYRFDAARRRSGVAFQFRDLRAKAATDKADAQDMRQAQRQLGHASVVMTEAYVRARRGDKVTPTR